MANYYFLTTLLPELHIDAKPSLDFAEFDVLLKENLTAKDYAACAVVRRLYDIENMRALWSGKSHDPYGNLSEILLIRL